MGHGSDRNALDDGAGDRAVAAVVEPGGADVFDDATHYHPDLSNRNLLDLVEVDLVAGTVVELGGLGAFVIGDGLGVFTGPAILPPLSATTQALETQVLSSSCVLRGPLRPAPRGALGAFAGTYSSSSRCLR